MADTPTDEYGLRQQGLGDNTNTWGDDKLNEVIRGIAQIAGSIKSIALTGDYTITSTNYVTTADNKNAGHLFTGSLAAAATITYPSTQTKWLIHNTSNAALTAKCSGGTGVVIPNGMMAWVYCDGTDIKAVGQLINGATQINGVLTVAGLISGVTAGVLGTDATNLTQVNALIAAGAIPGAPGTVKVDAAATAGYLGTVLTASGGVTLTDNGDTMDIGVTIPPVSVTWEEALAGKLTGTLTTGTTAMTANSRYRISSTATGTLPTLTDGQAVIVEFTVGSGVTGTVGRNSQTIDGASADDTYTGDGSNGPIVMYSFVSAGVVTSTLIGSMP